MAQPEFVPAADTDRAPEELLPAAPRRWEADRPAEVVDGGQPRGARLGNIGPDQGYALKIAKTFSGRLKLGEDEHEEDAIAGCLGIALKRASLNGRAPVIYDLEFAFTVWGFLGGAPDDLITFRKRLFSSSAHHYWDQREIVDTVRDSAYELSSNDVRASLHDWTVLIDANLAPRINKRTAAMKLLSDVSGDEN